MTRRKPKLESPLSIALRQWTEQCRERATRRALAHYSRWNQAPRSPEHAVLMVQVRAWLLQYGTTPTSAELLRAPASAPQPLSCAQALLLDALRQWIATHGTSPTVRELMEARGSRSINGTHQALRLLANRGFLEMEPATVRGIRLHEAWRPKP